MSNKSLAWADLLAEEKTKDYFKNVMYFVESERQAGKQIFPQKQDVFNAFKYTPLNDLKVVILGQDPYHGVNQAHGLAFSVQGGIPIPPSLKNIYKELQTDIGISSPKNGDLSFWATQGVLLMNTTLTVEAHKAYSHAGKGWEIFTDAVIKKINESLEGVVFLLWGGHARKKSKMIDKRKHFVLESAHPSPLSAYRGFLGCEHFSRCNAYLKENGRSGIDWG